MFRTDEIDWSNPVNDHPLNRGLVSWWLPSEHSSGGGVLFDLKGKYHGTLGTGALRPTWMTGPQGYRSLSFNDSSTKVDCGKFIDPDYVTVEAVIYPLGWSQWNYIAGKEAGFSPYFSYTFRSDSGTTLSWYVSVGSNYYAATATAPTANKWSHVVGTYDGETSVMYVNGKSVASNSSMSGVLYKLPTINFIIGDSYSWAGRSFNGRIASVSIRNRAMTANEVYSLYVDYRNMWTNGLRRLTRQAYYKVSAAPATSILPFVNHYMLG